MALLPRTLQAGPNIPDLPGASPQLINYLRTFALWCRHGFADKLSASTAVPGLLLLANDAPSGTTPKVFMIQVTTAGTIVAKPVAIASGTPP